MEAFFGSWKLQDSRNEGPVRELIVAIEIDDKYVDMFAKAVYTVNIEDAGNGQYKYTFNMEGSSDKHVVGPFKLGETFEFYDPFCKRTEQITVTMEGSKSKEVTVIKEKPELAWTIHRYIQGGEMVVETQAKDLKTKNYLVKV